MVDASLEFKDPYSPSFVIRTLGRFDVIKDGQSLVLSSSGSKKIWELYKFMLAHREMSFTPEALMDQLWVSEEYSDLRSTLRRQMHRLRRTLFEEECKEHERTLLFSNGYYRWNDKVSVHLDADSFEDLIKHGDGLKETAPQNALEVYQTALNLYHGDYLPDCVDQHWVFSIRNHLRRLFLRTVLNVIELLKGKGAYDEILPLCQKAIKIDVYEEAFHLSMMDALLNRGDQKQALEHYEYITGFYYREMGVKPSEEMRGIYKRMLKTQTTVQVDDNLYEALESNVSMENAFYCEPEVFKSIYELEKRRSQRSGASFSIGVITAVSQRGDTPSQEELRKKQLQLKLMERLRKGDSLTRWNENQFVVLLPGVDGPLLENVLHRVLDLDADPGKVVIEQITHLTPEPQQR